jgi:hypothetical protein
MRIFSGKQFYAAGWKRTKPEIQKSAEWYRSRGYLARVVRDRNLPAYEKGSMNGYGLYVRGMQGTKR